MIKSLKMILVFILLLSISCFAHGKKQQKDDVKRSDLYAKKVKSECLQCKSTYDFLKKTFTFEGAPINPNVIQSLTPWSSDFAPSNSDRSDVFISSINLKESQSSNKFYYDKDNFSFQTPSKKSDKFKYEAGYLNLNEEGTQQTAFSYKYFGKLRNGLHFVTSYENNGGTYTQVTHFLFKIQKESFYKYVNGSKNEIEGIIIKTAGFLENKKESEYILKNGILYSKVGEKLVKIRTP